MVVFVEEVLFLICVGGNSQLDLPNKAIVVLSIDEDVSRSLIEAILHSHYLKLRIILLKLLQSLNDIDDLFLIGVAFASKKVKDFQRD